MTNLAEKLAALPVRSLSLGYRTIKLVEPGELDDAQSGYARTPDGESLDGDGPGAWQRSWVVIGHDDLADPIFVDTADADLPVYTAAHGQGDWPPHMIAESLPQFSKALRYLKPLTAGRESPVALETNPLDDPAAVMEKVGELTACPDAPFWSDWFDGDATSR